MFSAAALLWGVSGGCTGTGRDPAALPVADTLGIKYIDIVNWSHTDYGFTDHPMILAELQKRYIDVAVDLAHDTKDNAPGERFAWTCEALDPLLQWWEESSEDRRDLLLDAIENGQIDANVLPFHIHPTLGEEEISMFANWGDEEIVDKIHPTVAIQNDVNGFPRSAAMQLLDRGIRHIWLGMNGHQPFDVPTASWWVMPDGRKILVWLGVPYWGANGFFHNGSWRSESRNGHEVAYRWPRDGEMFKTDEQSMKKAQEICVRQIRNLQKKGYKYDFLALTFSNQWRSDNDGPYPGIVPFVRKWNEMGLKPALRLRTAGESIADIERSVGSTADTISGEFGDWWAFGVTSLPRELAVARKARYALKAAHSPVFGDLSEGHVRRSREIVKDLCVFGEHTYAANSSRSDIYGEKNQGTMNEVNRYAYKAYESAHWMLAQRVRARLFDEPGGLYAINAGPSEYSGWVEVRKSSLRNNRVKSVRDARTGEVSKLYQQGSNVKFWVDGLSPESMRRYELSEEEAGESPVRNMPEIKKNANGWPLSVKWEGMDYPLYEGNIGNISVSRVTDGGWWGCTCKVEPHESAESIAKVTETPYSIVFTQKLHNDRLLAIERRLEIMRDEPRARLSITYDRPIHADRELEVIYADFPFPDVPRKVLTSEGGMPYEPYKDNVANTCKGYYVADSWVRIENEDGIRVWSTGTTPVFELGRGMFFLNGDIKEPDDSYRLSSMLYNNAWGLNFPVEYTGKTVCEYDLFWSSENLGINDTEDICDTYIMDKPVLLTPDIKDYDVYNRWLNHVGK